MRVQEIVVGGDAITQMHPHTIIDMAAHHRLPTAYPSGEFIDAAGLVAYGVNYPDLHYRFASFIDKILKGAKPSDLPIERPVKFELVINTKTAAALKIYIPQSVPLRANRVIE